MAQVVEHLPSKREALHSNPNTVKIQNKTKSRGEPLFKLESEVILLK
jgi:hypothetical protein